MGCPLLQCFWLIGLAALLARSHGEVGTFFVASTRNGIGFYGLHCQVVRK